MSGREHFSRESINDLYKSKKIVLKIVILTIILFISNGAIVSGGHITIDVNIDSPVILHNSTIVNVTINQTGDEAAYEVSVLPLLSEGFSYSGYMWRSVLPSGEELKGDFTIVTSENLTNGTYPFVALVRYDDSRSHSYTAVHPHLLTFKDKDDPSVIGTLYNIQMFAENNAQTLLMVENVDLKSQEVIIKFYLPNELEGSISDLNLLLEAGDSEQIYLDIQSSDVVPGSSYIILASVEYEDNGYHYTSFTDGRIIIIEETIEGGNIIFWAAVVLFIILLFFYIFEKIKRKKK